MDVPVAPAVVMEQPAPCRDAATAEELLRRTLSPALAPRSGWKVSVRFSKKGSSIVVEGEISDEVDAPVAHRVLTEGRPECGALARAVGVWAGLVLDAEVERAARPPPPPPTPPPAINVTPAPTEKPPPESSLLLAHGEGEKTVEFGASMFLMGGTGGGVLAGPTLFAVLEAGRGWFLRPNLFVGRTIEEISGSADVYATLAATRFDACGRIPGFYIEHHGIQLDVCGGADLGFTYFDSPSTIPMSGGTQPGAGGSRTVPFFGLGPSMSLRGELGSGLALAVRGVADVNVISESFRPDPVTDPTLQVQSSLIVGRGELCLSWQLR